MHEQSDNKITKKKFLIPTKRRKHLGVNYKTSLK